MMPRPRPPHLQYEFTRHKRKVWYVRIGRGPRTRIKSEFGTAEFDAEYAAAIAGNPRPKKGAPAVGTLGWLLARYRETADWTSLSNATRRQRENIFKGVLKTAGDESYSKITTATILAGIDRRKDTPAQARNFLGAMRGLFKWAAKAKHVRDVTSGIETPQRPKTEGFIPWTEDMVTAYHKKWRIGTRQRVWLDVLLYTGLRRGDAVRLGRQHVRDGIATLKTEKSQGGIEVTLPILPILQTTLDAGPCGDLSFICGERGQPMSKESFGNEFRIACNKAEVPGSAHGVRKLAATRMANNGATTSQLQAVFGWTDVKMPALYTKDADRRRLAKEAMSMIANKPEKSIPAPRNKVRAQGRKAK